MFIFVSSFHHNVTSQHVYPGPNHAGSPGARAVPPVRRARLVRGATPLRPFGVPCAAGCPSEGNATRRRPARPPAGLFLHSLLVAWQPKPHLALRSPGRALPHLANQPSTPPNSTTRAPTHRRACPPCDPCAPLPPNRASRGTEEPPTRPRPPHWNGAHRGPRRRLLSSKHTHLHLRGIFFATFPFWRHRGGEGLSRERNGLMPCAS